MSNNRLLSSHPYKGTQATDFRLGKYTLNEEHSRDNTRPHTGGQQMVRDRIRTLPSGPGDERQDK